MAWPWQCQQSALALHLRYDAKSLGNHARIGKWEIACHPQGGMFVNIKLTKFLDADRGTSINGHALLPNFHMIKP
ncbi:MAG: hypothetical protein NZ899_10385 [Thermoguttaceae bacterium]|nr:hypothetical protein [Thermoguttaceae bacterium]MDW8078187.1 hypothetical protein [Thermoguttaceae bacterium]